MPSKDIENGAEEDEEDPLLPSGRWMDQNEDSTSGERRSGCSESVANPLVGHRGHSAGHDGEAHQHPNGMSADQPIFAIVTVATCHCGAGCVLGDIVGEWLVYWSGASISRSMLYAAFVVGKSTPIPGSDLPNLLNALKLSLSPQISPSPSPSASSSNTSPSLPWPGITGGKPSFAPRSLISYR